MGFFHSPLLFHIFMLSPVLRIPVFVDFLAYQFGVKSYFDTVQLKEYQNMHTIISTVIENMLKHTEHVNKHQRIRHDVRIF